MWRWSLVFLYRSIHKLVFSTYVEVIPYVIFEPVFLSSILHVCGGDPRIPREVLHPIQYSPRMWRWSYFIAFPPELMRVFSTYVEVIRSQATSFIAVFSILHVCGGDPESTVAECL